jgi:hypothetical protein
LGTSIPWSADFQVLECTARMYHSWSVTIDVYAALFNKEIFNSKAKETFYIIINISLLKIKIFSQ